MLPPSSPPQPSAECQILTSACDTSDFTLGTKKSLGAYKGKYEAHEWVGGVYYISDTQNHNDEDSNLEQQLNEKDSALQNLLTESNAAKARPQPGPAPKVQQ